MTWDVVVPLYCGGVGWFVGRAIAKRFPRLPWPRCTHSASDFTASPHDDGAVVTGECRRCHTVTDRKFVAHSDQSIARAAAEAYALCRTAGMSHAEAEAIAAARARRVEWDQIAAAFKAFNNEEGS